MGFTLKEVLLQSWDYAMDQEDWAPPLAAALQGVNEEQALWKPKGEAGNSIWETVNHLAYYKERLLRNIKGLPPLPDLESNTATFTVTESGEEDWKAAVENLKNVHAELREYIAALDEDGGPENKRTELLMSLVLHDSYHTGQIVLVRKLQGSWPGQRSFD
ncbi:DinB family protein [Paenibacillus glufosinatiresistens]|uniref:DinB family protein n=1 Tax=Paenibacillus glufosinatiresistens TaxID=3070657 RepID=UPI00286EA4DD|nr:DinB family protein [Paenibacillus sp. YX.27]